MLNRETKVSDTSQVQNYDLLLAEEALILDAQIAIQRLLNERGMTQVELARRMGVTESYISQMLGASARNLTLRTVARVMTALGEIPEIAVKRAHGNVDTKNPYQCDADFGPWGDIVILDAPLDQSNDWLARDWAANENDEVMPEWAEAA